MRTWKELLKSLTERRGFNADGRVLGLGLATAQEAHRRNTADEAEKYLRQNTEQRSTIR